MNSSRNSKCSARWWKRRAEERTGQDGYVLLAALWLLLLGGLIATSVLATSLWAARDTSAHIKQWHQQVSLEGAVHAVIHDLLREGHRSQWLATGYAALPDGQEATSIEVKVSWEAGRVDLNTASWDVIERAYAAAGAPPADIRQAVASLLTRREGVAGQHLGRLREVPGIDLPYGACLRSLVTLWSGLPSPEPRLAPERIAEALLLSAPPIREDEFNIPDLYGATLRVEARTLGPEGARLLVVVRLTGSLSRPFWIQAWEWNPQGQRTDCG